MKERNDDISSIIPFSVLLNEYLIMQDVWGEPLMIWDFRVTDDYNAPERMKIRFLYHYI